MKHIVLLLFVFSFAQIPLLIFSSSSDRAYDSQKQVPQEKLKESLQKFSQIQDAQKPSLSCTTEKSNPNQKKISSDLKGKPPPSQKENYQVKMNEVCSKPAKFLCSQSLNPYVEIEKKNETAFYEMAADAKYDPSVLDFISNKKNGKTQNCFQLSGKKKDECMNIRFSSKCSELSVADFQACQKLTNQILSKKLFTEDRKAKAKKIFEQARLDIIKLLEKRKKALSSLNLKNVEPAMDEMIKSITKVQLNLNQKIIQKRFCIQVHSVELKMQFIRREVY